VGSSRRKKPAKLGQKLKHIRDQFGYSFTQMAEQLSDKNIKVLRTDVSRFEKGFREPSLVVLLKYAKLGKVTIDFLADDKLKFP